MPFLNNIQKWQTLSNMACNDGFIICILFSLILIKLFSGPGPAGKHCVLLILGPWRIYNEPLSHLICLINCWIKFHNRWIVLRINHRNIFIWRCKLVVVLNSKSSSFKKNIYLSIFIRKAFRKYFWIIVKIVHCTYGSAFYSSKIFGQKYLINPKNIKFVKISYTSRLLVQPMMAPVLSLTRT